MAALSWCSLGRLFGADALKVSYVTSALVPFCALLISAWNDFAAHLGFSLLALSEILYIGYIGNLILFLSILAYQSLCPPLVAQFSRNEDFISSLSDQIEARRRIDDAQREFVTSVVSEYLKKNKNRRG